LTFKGNDFWNRQQREALPGTPLALKKPLPKANSKKPTASQFVIICVLQFVSICG
jgi:hypothetical protein